MSKNTKTFSIRLDSDFIQEFNTALDNFPITFKSQSVIKSYMQNIIDLSKSLNKGNSKEFGFVKSGSGFAIVDLDNPVNKIKISEDIFNVKE